MIEYKILKTKEEFKLVEELCKKNNLVPKIDGLTIMAVQDDKILGVINMDLIPSIELFISENPIVGNNLFRMIEGNLLTSGTKFVRCNPTPSLEKLYTKVGFEVVKADKIIMEKKYYG